jgi:hypothetical protein
MGKVTQSSGDGSLGRVTTAAAGLWICNFFVFCLIAQLLGGDAVNGEAVQGRYYLADHGFLTEVDRRTWLYSWVHAQLVLVGGVLVLVSALVSRPKESFPAYVFPVVLGGMVTTAMLEFLKAARGPAGNRLTLVSVFLGVAVALVSAWLISRYGVDTPAETAAEQVDEAESRRAI